VQVAAGDSICAAVSVEGDLRVWGSFRVCHFFAWYNGHNLRSL